MVVQTPRPRCPQCRRPVVHVWQPEPCMFNDDQWQKLKAGDYACDTCSPNNRSKGNKRCYWWKNEVVIEERV